MAGRLHQTPICGRAESMFHTRAVPHVHKAAQCPALSYRYAQQISDGLIRPQSPIHSVHFPRSKLCHHLTAAHPARNPFHSVCAMSCAKVSRIFDRWNGECRDCGLENAGRPRRLANTLSSQCIFDIPYSLDEQGQYF